MSNNFIINLILFVYNIFFFYFLHYEINEKNFKSEEQYSSQRKANIYIAYI